tara:strand:- start:9213 stop:9398 length:186 start_codon:yes stop_codon:yes gene_type:complete
MENKSTTDWSMSIRFTANTIENGIEKDYYSFGGEVLDEKTLQAVKEAVLKAMIDYDRKRAK